MKLRSVVHAFSNSRSRRRLLMDVGVGTFVVVALVASLATLASADPVFPMSPPPIRTMPPLQTWLHGTS